MAALGVEHVETCRGRYPKCCCRGCLSPLPTPDSLAQIQLIGATADADVAILDQHRARRA